MARRLMMRCPTSGEPVPTQLSLDAATFETITLPEFIVLCRSCAQLHRWTRQDVWLEAPELSAKG